VCPLFEHGLHRDKNAIFLKYFINCSLYEKVGMLHFRKKEYGKTPFGIAKQKCVTAIV
jgi:hypothetical protein